MHILTNLKQKFPHGKWFYAGRIFLFILAYVFLIFIDLHYLGSQKHWNVFDRIRIKTYLKSGILVGYLTPPIGPLRAIHYSSVLGNAFLNKELPDRDNMDFYRNLLMHTAGNSSKKQKNTIKYPDSFATKLRHHEQLAILQFSRTGKTSFTKDYSQTIELSSYGIPMYDVWIIYITTTVINRAPKTAYLVWGMGVATDKNSEVFFGGQMGTLQHVLPLKWFNKLESQGLAKGYWSLLTEENGTSEFSYSKRFLKPGTRKSIWLKNNQLRHLQGIGKNANEIISLSF
jgi:hypothetical protein